MSQRPRYAELRAVMTQIPKINITALDQYDHALSDPNSLKAGDKKRKDKFKKLIAGALGVMLCLATREQHLCSRGDLSCAGFSAQQRRDSACCSSTWPLSASSPCLTRVSSPTLSPRPQTALCQQFRKEVHIRNLPSLFKKPKPDKDLLTTEHLGLEALFGPDSKK